jgi:hypothetical protein
VDIDTVRVEPKLPPFAAENLPPSVRHGYVDRLHIKWHSTATQIEVRAAIDVRKEQVNQGRRAREDFSARCFVSG